MNLGPVGGVGQTAGAETIPQRQGHIILFRDLQQLVKVFEERVFLVVVSHPLDGKGSAARDHVHQSPLVLHPLNRSQRSHRNER